MAKKNAAAAAPAPAPVEEEVIAIEEGTLVRFVGYDESVPKDERILEEGQELTVTAIGAEGDDEAIFVSIDNPDFNPKKKEHPETNPKTLEVQVLATEIEVIEEEAEEEEEAAEAEAAAPAPAPAPAKATKGASKATTKAADKAPAKGAGKGAGKGTGKAVTKKAADRAAEAAEAIDPDALPDLETEDETVANLVAENEGNLLAVAQELEQAAAISEYQLGGILYHLKKSGEYKTVEDGAYDKDGGWAEFIPAYFNVQYRKAQYLIEIYVAFSQRGIENAAEVVAGMGWSKASKIAKPLMDEEVDADELIEAANTNTVEDLSEVVKSISHEGGEKGTKGEKVKKITFKLRLVHDDAAAAETMMAAAQEKLGVKDPADAFMVILTEWYQNNVKVEAAPKATAKAAAKKTAVKRAAATA